MEIACARPGAQWPGQIRENSCILQSTITDDTETVLASCNCVHIFMRTNICSRNILSKLCQRTNTRIFGIFGSPLQRRHSIHTLLLCRKYNYCFAWPDMCLISFSFAWTFIKSDHTLYLACMSNYWHSTYYTNFVTGHSPVLSGQCDWCQTVTSRSAIPSENQKYHHLNFRPISRYICEVPLCICACQCTGVVRSPCVFVHVSVLGLWGPPVYLCMSVYWGCEVPLCICTCQCTGVVRSPCVFVHVSVLGLWGPSVYLCMSVHWGCEVPLCICACQCTGVVRSPCVFVHVSVLGLWSPPVYLCMSVYWGCEVPLCICECQCTGVVRSPCVFVNVSVLGWWGPFVHVSALGYFSKSFLKKKTWRQRSRSKWNMMPKSEQIVFQECAHSNHAHKCSFHLHVLEVWVQHTYRTVHDKCLCTSLAYRMVHDSHLR